MGCLRVHANYFAELCNRSFAVLKETAHARTHRRPILQQLKGRHLHHSFPFNHCFRDMHMDAALVGRLRSWTLQFVYLRPVVSVLSVGLQVRCSVWWPGSQWQVHTLTTRHM